MMRNATSSSEPRKNVKITPKRKKEKSLAYPSMCVSIYEIQNMLEIMLTY